MTVIATLVKVTTTLTDSPVVLDLDIVLQPQVYGASEYPMHSQILLAVEAVPDFVALALGKDFELQ